jgi:hypothetical protein
MIGPYIIRSIIGISPTTWEILAFDYFTPSTFMLSFTQLSLYLRAFLGNIPPSLTSILSIGLFGLCVVAFIRSPMLHAKSLWFRIGWATLTFLSYMGFLFVMMFILIARSDGVVNNLWLLLIPMPFITSFYIFTHALLLQIKFSQWLPYILAIVILSTFTILNTFSIKEYVLDFGNPSNPTAPYFFRTGPALYAIQHPEIPFDELNVDIPYAAHAIRKILYPYAQ